MKKSQIIKDVLGKRLEPYGFKYEGYTPHGSHCMWKLGKTLETGVEQYIVVYKPAGGAYLRLELNTSIHNASVYMKDITNDKKYANVFFPYLDDQEFCAILVLFGDFMVEYGLKKLDEISVPLFYYHPDEQMYRDLYQNHNELAGSFTKKYQLTEDITLNGSIPVIQSMLTKKNEKIFDNDTKRLLLEITAFLGIKIIQEYGGRWEWNDYLNMCDLNGVNKEETPYCLHHLLGRTVWTWERSDMQYLLDMCHKIFRDAKVMDMQKELYDNRVELSLRFVNKNANSKNLSLEESFNLVASSVIMSENHIFNDKQIETILEASAFLSEKFIFTYGGEWLWDENRNMCVIDTKYPADGKHLYAFLDIILTGWEKSDTKTLLNEFAQIVQHLQC